VIPTLHVHGAVLARLACVPARPYEVGGWLLGYWSDDSDSLFVTHATPPASKGTPCGVRISGRGHRKLFDQAWDASDGIVTFLGDWHTHPGSPPLPSARDIRAIAKLASDPKFDTPNPLIAIVSTARFPWRAAEMQMAFYLGDRTAQAQSLVPVVAKHLPPEAATVPEWRWPPVRRDRRGGATRA
jgi:integrative and conjugative element protein (TIGR02256 family)